MTALHYAARQGFADVAQVLLKAGATVDSREANDITPLLMAISNNNMAAAHYLLAHGGDVNAQDWYGRSPLWEAVNVRNL
jgi:ankyrin repeat protein